ncbi:MAG TPA: hypothetical protein VKA06_07390 [Spirochaetia bacterium]|nr:hypothetical protein [Spirochaetia bacterium]
MNPTQPLELPDSFDETMNMPMTDTGNGRFHVTRSAAGLARRLVENGTDIDLERAVGILESVLRCQETGDDDPHRGNFYWMAEDSVVADLNAVEFILAQMIPMLCDHRDRLTSFAPTLVADLLTAVTAGLDEIERLDVHVGYTNIAILDIYNTSLGGILLDDDSRRARARKKLEEWIGLTLHGGHPLEYNSPTYTPIALRSLASLADRTDDADVAVLARTMAARIALSVGLRLHRPTTRWAGPHGRAYHDSVREGTTAREQELLDEMLPTSYAWMQGLLDSDYLPTFVEESVSPEQGFTMTTLLERSFSLGTASKPFTSQSNAVISYITPGSVFYTRYLTDDKWYGDFYHATDRSTTRNLLDEGLFYGVQEHGAVLGAYAPSSLEGASGAKAVLVWSDMSQIDEVLVGLKPVAEYPAVVPPGESVGVSVGGAYFVVQPLTSVPLGSGAGTHLVERDGSLLLELVQYRGQPKDFWELRWPGGFYQGKPLNAFYLETAEKSDHASLSEFVSLVSGGTFAVELDPARTYDGRSTRTWTAEYRRGTRTIGLSIELYAWNLIRRWNAEGEKGYPKLEVKTLAESMPLARHGVAGTVEAGGARLQFARGDLWLYGDPENRIWFGGFCAAPGSEGEVTLSTPDGTITLAAARAGWVCWNDGVVTSEAIGSATEPVRNGGASESARHDV